mgnify:CR=1 FL=1
MAKYLAIQNTYQEVQAALYNGNTIIAQKTISKYHASAQLIPTLQNLFDDHLLNLNEIAFIGVNIGPGPFTTLRTVMATVNGLAFSASIPLIGIDAFDAYCAQFSAKTPFIILFNAFGSDVYYAIKTFDEYQKGVMHINELLEVISKKYSSEAISFFGNGAMQYKKQIEEKSFKVLDSEPYCTLKSIAHSSYQKWEHDKMGSQKLLPLYLKKHPAQK